MAGLALSDGKNCAYLHCISSPIAERKIKHHIIGFNKQSKPDANIFTMICFYLSVSEGP